jgi:hypothetical protein
MPLIDLSTPVVIVPTRMMDAATTQGVRDETTGSKEEVPGKDKGVAEPAVSADVSATLIGYRGASRRLIPSALWVFSSNLVRRSVTRDPGA